MNRIIVIVSGGVVQHVSGIPANCVVEIRDYDVDSDDGLDVDENGDRYFRGEWTAEAGKEPGVTMF